MDISTPTLTRIQYITPNDGWGIDIALKTITRFIDILSARFELTVVTMSLLSLGLTAFLKSCLQATISETMTPSHIENETSTPQS